MNTLNREMEEKLTSETLETFLAHLSGQGCSQISLPFRGEKAQLKKWSEMENMAGRTGLQPSNHQHENICLEQSGTVSGTQRLAGGRF